MVTYPPNVKYADHFQQLQRDARLAGRGAGRLPRGGGTTMLERYDWVGWLGGPDAQVLFLWLMRGFENGTALGTRRDMVEG